jgi:hypothetical protein
MEQVQNPITTTLKTSELPFELAPEVKHWFVSELDKVNKPNNYRECFFIFPDRFIDHQSLLSIVMFQSIGKQCWEIRDISIYQVTEQGQSTELAGIIDGKVVSLIELKKAFYETIYLTNGK